MGKKTQDKKRRLGKKFKQARRMPLLVTLRTHRKLQFNRFSRNWRKQKIKLDD
ncbi:MAG: 50S ribosomal protein L39e [Candidatus Micrarchaeota archaeon]|nr:50S ribosomal protein L39e [Candidatus Micrarchaeota archaeon]